MTECLLTNEEIRIILETLEYNPALRYPNAISLGNERTSIYKVTPINGLILIKGDSHTGFTHINERHNYWSENYYWKEVENSVKLDDPSKFSRKSIPIIDYATVAETLYSEVNSNSEKNKRPEIFEMFSGEVEDVNNGKMKYHMLLYKDTKIIHTIFPHSKKHNKEKYINYRRGKPKGKFLFNPIISTIAIPYFNEKNIVVYSFQVIKDYEKKIETGIIVNHRLDKSVTLYERVIERIEEFNFEVKMMNHTDLSKIEKIIKELDKKEKQ